jgi:uncharacterized protein (TIGR02118 family)
MPEPKLVVLYPAPADIDKFNQDYEQHMKTLHEKLHIPEDVHPYSITRFVETPMGRPAYYQMFVFYFASIEAMQQQLNSPAWLALGEDASRISTGGAPVFLIGA